MDKDEDDDENEDEGVCVMWCGVHFSSFLGFCFRFCPVLGGPGNASSAIRSENRADQVVANCLGGTEMGGFPHRLSTQDLSIEHVPTASFVHNSILENGFAPGPVHPGLVSNLISSSALTI